MPTCFADMEKSVFKNLYFNSNSNSDFEVSILGFRHMSRFGRSRARAG